jgi:HD-like signal output (HDOD) protein
MQRHGLLVGAIARRVAGNDPRIGDDAFMAGILHDVGKLVLMKVEPDGFAECQARARSERRPTYEVERERFGVSHAEVGGYLLGIWGLPYPIVEAVANHHAPGRVTQPRADVLTAVYVGDLLVHEQEGRMAAADDPAPPLDERYLEQAGALEHLPEWREFAASQVGSDRAGAWGHGKTAEAA